MTFARWTVLLACAGALPGCATKGQVQLLATQIQTMRVETARRDSARAAALAAVLALQQRMMDSLAAGREALRTLDVRLQGDFTDVQRQLLQVQELTGQSQQRLSDLKAQLDARAEQAAAVRSSGGAAGAPSDTTARPAGPTADQLYQNARNQHVRAAPSTARSGYQEFLRAYPADPRAPDALYYIGETFRDQMPDSAIAYYVQVVGQFPRSSKASTALLQLGKLAEARRDPGTARTYYERILRDFPRSDDADLARERIKNLRP